MRIGFCCKYVDQNANRVEELNTNTTTVAWLNRQSRIRAEQKLWDLLVSNIQSTKKLIEAVGNFDPALRMLRIGSDMLPVYTEPTWFYYYRDAAVVDYCEREFAKIGDLARSLDVRLSFHPGQFCVLASENDDIVNRSIEEFEYHVNMARWMGYGKTWHDNGFKINVHISGRRGAQGIIDTLPRLSPEARNLITIENDENRHGLDATLELERHVALVLDIHHHWINSSEYIQPNDDRVRRVIDSWRSVRPVLHYSVSREDILVGHCSDSLPSMQTLLESGYKKQKLRAHSDMMWNRAANQWALSFADNFDIQVESKFKNLASSTLYNQFRTSASRDLAA